MKKDNLKMYVILDGKVKTGGKELLGRGEMVEFDPEEMKAIDPNGTEFCSPEQWEIIAKKEALEAEMAALEVVEPSADEAPVDESSPKRKRKNQGES